MYNYMYDICTNTYMIYVYCMCIYVRSIYTYPQRIIWSCLMGYGYGSIEETKDLPAQVPSSAHNVSWQV